MEDETPRYNISILLRITLLVLRTRAAYEDNGVPRHLTQLPCSALNLHSQIGSIYCLTPLIIKLAHTNKQDKDKQVIVHLSYVIKSSKSSRLVINHKQSNEHLYIII